MDDELGLALAKFFLVMWEDYTSHVEGMMENTLLVETKIATAKDVEDGEAPEECEEGDTYYVLSKIGKRAFEFVKGRE